jgi:hypothetical protein
LRPELFAEGFLPAFTGLAFLPADFLGDVRALLFFALALAVLDFLVTDLPVPDPKWPR